MFLSERSSYFGCQFVLSILWCFCLKKVCPFWVSFVLSILWCFCLKKEAYLGVISAKHFVIFWSEERFAYLGAISVKHFAMFLSPKKCISGVPFLWSILSSIAPLLYDFFFLGCLVCYPFSPFFFSLMFVVFPFPSSCSCRESTKLLMLQ